MRFSLRDIDTCPRCETVKPLIYRVRSDIIDMIVCAKCARQAALLDGELEVERIYRDVERPMYRRG